MFRESRVKQLSSEVSSYLAGFLDGEGSFLIVRSKGSYQTHICAANTNLEILEWIQTNIGVGSICFQDRGFGRKRAHYWYMNKLADEKRLIDQIFPFLKVKRAQAEILKSFVELRLNQPRGIKKSDGVAIQENDLYLQMRKLNRKGL